MQTQRLDGLDIAKGIAILLVVYGHVMRGLQVAGLVSFDGVWGYVDYLVYTVHMPVFFVVSGFLYEGGRARQAQVTGAAPSFWRPKLLTIAWPYFFWSSVHLVSQAAMSGSGLVNNGTSLDRIATIGWDPVSPFWFLYALFIAFTVSFLLQTLSARMVTLAAFVAMFVVHRLQVPPLFGDLAYGLVYFSIGRLVFSERLTAPLRSVVTLGLATAGFVLSATIAYRLDLDVRLATIGTLCGLIAFFMLSTLLAGSALRRPLVILGRCTMGIYVMHILVIATVRAVGLKVLHLDLLSVVIGCVALAVALPLTAQVIANRIGIARFVGLQTRLDDVLWRRRGNIVAGE
ncbi:MAG: acyltransferase [Rhizobium sp.]|nr:acyltransferase [Rhizobium sp.]